MALLTEEVLKEYSDRVGITKRAGLLIESKSLSYGEKHDVFLSHSYRDRDLILGVKLMLEAAGLTVYVDWINDGQLSREEVTMANAERIRTQMGRSRSLLYCQTPNAPVSKWMPWELGSMDAMTNGRCAIAPIYRDNAPSEFKGQEYLGLYPYVDLTSGRIYIHRELRVYTTMHEWLAGGEPVKSGS